MSDVLPTPGSPRRTSTPLRPPRAASRSRSSASRSLDRPRNAGARCSAAMALTRYPESRNQGPDLSGGISAQRGAVGGARRVVDAALRPRDRLVVEARQPRRDGLHLVVEPVVGDRAVDVPV